jgi:hypothetical protein
MSKEMRLEGDDWIHLAQDVILWKVSLNVAMNLRVSYKADRFLWLVEQIRKMQVIIGKIEEVIGLNSL